MAQPSINRAKGKLDKHSKMQLRIALSILYMQENKTENEKIREKEKAETPAMPEPLPGRGNTRTGAIPLCYLLYARKRNEKWKIRKKRSRDPVGGSPCWFAAITPPKKKTHGQEAVPLGSLSTLYMQEKRTKSRKTKRRPLSRGRKNGALHSARPSRLRKIERRHHRSTASACAPAYILYARKQNATVSNRKKKKQRPPLAKEPLPYAQPIWPGRKEISGRLPRIANLPISICKKMHWKPKKDKRPAFGASPCAARNLAAAKLAAKIRINRGKDFFVIQPLYICKKTKRNLPVWQKKQQRHTRPDKRLCCAWQEAKEVLRNDKPLPQMNNRKNIHRHRPVRPVYQRTPPVQRKGPAKARKNQNKD